MRDTERLEKRLSKKRRNCLREPSKDYDHDPDHHHDHGAISVAFCFFFFPHLVRFIDRSHLPSTYKRCIFNFRCPPTSWSDNFNDVYDLSLQVCSSTSLSILIASFSAFCYGHASRSYLKKRRKISDTDSLRNV